MLQDHQVTRVVQEHCRCQSLQASMERLIATPMWRIGDHVTLSVHHKELRAIHIQRLKRAAAEEGRAIAREDWPYLVAALRPLLELGFGSVEFAITARGRIQHRLQSISLDLRGCDGCDELQRYDLFAKEWGESPQDTLTVDADRGTPLLIIRRHESPLTIRRRNQEQERAVSA